MVFANRQTIDFQVIVFRFHRAVICRCFACTTAFRQHRVSMSGKLPASRREGSAIKGLQWLSNVLSF